MARTELVRPYDTVEMKHDRVRATNPDGTIKRSVRVDVAREYDEAQLRRVDYYHPGGEIRDKDGNVIGNRPPGWFLSGYKWQDDKPGIYAVITHEPEAPSGTVTE